MTLSTGHCPKWPIWQGKPGQRTEDSQIIHKHNGHQYWKDDRWDSRQRPGFNFYSLFFSCRRPYRFSQSHLSAIRPMSRRQPPPKSKPRAVVPLTQMTKWIKELSNNDCDRNNDTIKMFGGLWQGNTKYTPCGDTTVSNITVKAKF